MKRLRLAGLALVLLAVAFAGVAEACPQCAGRQGGGNLIPILIGAIILFPFGVVFVIHRIIKSAPPGHDPRIGR